MKYEALIFARQSIDPHKWDDFIHGSSQGCLYVLCHYMDIISPDWQAVIVSDEKGWVAVMPFNIQRKKGFIFSIQPILSQYWGIYYNSAVFSGNYEKYSFIRSVTLEILNTLPSVDYFQYSFSPECDYTLPFHWKKYSLYFRYTYYLDLSPDEEKMWKNLDSPLQRQIKKALKNEISAEKTTDYSFLLSLMNKNVTGGKDIVGTSNKKKVLETLKEIAEKLIETQSGFLYLCKDRQQNVISAGLFGYYQNKCIYLAGAFEPDTTNSGAMSLMMWTAIREAASHDRLLFDFEGSMIENVERFFRKFGAYPVRYPEIIYNNLPFYIKWITKLKS